MTDPCFSVDFGLFSSSLALSLAFLAFSDWFKKLVQPPGYSDKPFIVTQEEKNDIAANDEIERPEEDEEEEGAAEA